MDKSKCILWRGTKDKDGYGRVCINHTTEVRAHRISYLLFKGSIKKGLSVCHTCDTPACINPEHLWLGTTLENNRDAIKKGRAIKVKGELHGGAKLKQKEVDKIRDMYKNGDTQTSIAKEFNVSRRTIGFIVNNKTWII